MAQMFFSASSFNRDISKWDVMRVTDMSFMFFRALSFNGDISDWDVSRVIHMQNMFDSAACFAQTLCGDSWITSTADKNGMFDGSSGRICVLNGKEEWAPEPVEWAPESTEELRDAVED